MRGRDFGDHKGRDEFSPFTNMFRNSGCWVEFRVNYILCFLFKNKFISAILMDFRKLHSSPPVHDVLENVCYLLFGW
jgi:hypothetical protein